ncbi:MAG: class I SAM-dependent methyltransferase [Solirubrobacterales bacterium]
MEGSERTTPAWIRVTGRALNATIARAPWAWPVLRPALHRFFDRTAIGWDERTGAGSVDHLAAFAAACARVEPAPERVLDLGTGTGEAALFCAREFPRASIRGVDISEQMIRAAQDKVGLDPDGRIAFRVADAARLPYGEESFDLVAQLNMPPFFDEIARVVRPGGEVIVAASWGEATPFYTPHAVLERGFRRRGIEPVGAGEQGGGTWWLGRRTPT